MTAPPPNRALLRFAPAIALAVLTLGLLPLAGEEGRAPLLMLLTAPLATQLLVSAFAQQRPLIAATALPAVSLGALAIGPTMLPSGFPLWLLGALVAAIPPPSSRPLHFALNVAIAGAAAIGLLRADGDPAMIIVAVALILSIGLLSNCRSDGSLAGAEAMIADLQANLEEEVSAGRELRQERAQLEHSVEERLIALQATNRVLEREAQDLRHAKEQALEASRIKSSFLANVSHELRTPLNAIIGYTEMLLEEADERGSETAARDQRSVLSAAESLLKIVNDVLDLTKIEAGKLEIQTEVFPVIDIVEAIGTAALPLARRNNNTLKLKYSKDLGYLRTDRPKLNRVLLDLVTNACKFTHDGRVELRVDAVVIEDRRFFVFSITDTGIGISDEMMDRLFEPFRMADESSTREYGGLGLGLALAKYYTEMLGGEISVESTLGEGSVFRIRVPVEPEDPRASGHILVSMY